MKKRFVVTEAATSHHYSHQKHKKGEKMKINNIVIDEEYIDKLEQAGLVSTTSKYEYVKTIYNDIDNLFDSIAGLCENNTGDYCSQTSTSIEAAREAVHALVDAIMAQ